MSSMKPVTMFARATPITPKPTARGGSELRGKASGKSTEQLRAELARFFAQNSKRG